MAVDSGGLPVSPMGTFDAAGFVSMEVYKGRSTARWCVLALSSLMMVGSYYCFDNPSALNKQLELYFTSLVKEKHQMTHDEWTGAWTGLNMLYAIYSAPNILLPFFGGYFTDKYGARVVNIVCSSFILAGQVLVAMGAQAESFYLMLFGRFVFGLGGESLCVSQSAMVQQWFCKSLDDECQPRDGMGKPVKKFSAKFGLGLAFAMGLNLSLARGGSALNNWASPALEKHFSTAIQDGGPVSRVICPLNGTAAVHSLSSSSGSWAPHPAGTHGHGEKSGVPATLFFGVFVCILSTTAAILTYCIDRAYERAAVKEGHVAPPESGIIQGQLRGTTSETEQEASVGLRNVLLFHPAFWLLSISCVAVYATVIPFNSIAQAFLFEQFLCPGPTAADGGSCPNIELSEGVTEACLPTCIDRQCAYGQHTDRYVSMITKANTVMSIPYLISGFSSPFLGGIVDKFGHRVLLTTFSAVVLVAVHASFAFGPSGDHPAWYYVPLIGQGCAYAIYASSLWPSVQATVQQHEVGMAYGVVTAVQNCGLFVFPLIIGALRSHYKAYSPHVEAFFFCQASIGMVTGVLLYVVDRRYLGGRLEASGECNPIPEALAPRSMCMPRRPDSRRADGWVGGITEPLVA
jgi:MFS family permease